MHLFFFFFDTDFSKRLTSAMENQGLNKFSLATIADVSPATVQRWMDGKFEPRHRNLARLADALHVSGDYLLGRT